MSKQQNLSDTDLLQRLKTGDEQALRAVFDRYWDKLLAYAIHRLKNDEEAQEVVQDLFIKLWNIRETLNINVSLGAYLSKAITNRVYDRLDKLYRASQKNQSYLAASVEPVSAAADDLLFQKELQHEIEQAINLLPEKCRIIFVKSRFDGLSNTEIAQELNLSQRTVETHISNALKVLRRNVSGCILLLMMLEGSAIIPHLHPLNTPC